MRSLQLKGLDAERRHVLFTDADGQVFGVRVDEALRHAVRTAPQEHDRSAVNEQAVMRPRDIQAAVRAGADLDDLVTESGLDSDLIQRYAAPVLAERSYVAERGRELASSPDLDAPTLAELTTERLAGRDVDPDAVSWDAIKNDGRWSLQASYQVAGKDLAAHWDLDLAAGTIRPVDDEARWLTETEEAPSPTPQRHLSAVREVVVDVDAPAGEPAAYAEQAEPADQTMRLLDDLSRLRGRRVPLDFEDEMGTPSGAHPAASASQDALDAQILDLPPAHGPIRVDEDTDQRDTLVVDTRTELPLDLPEPEPEPQPDPAPPRPAPRSSRKRSKVPSWDEIVFGAKPE